MIFNKDPNKKTTKHAIIEIAILPIIDIYTKVRLNEKMLVLFISNFKHLNNITLLTIEILSIPILKMYK